MSKFVCLNKDCRNYGVEDEYLSNTYTMIDGKLVSKNAPCPVCGKMREEIIDAVPLSEKNIEIGKYSGSSPQQRREILQKRSHEHYEKHIKPYKEHKLHEAVTQFKEASRK